MNFEKIVGNEAVKIFLKRMIDKNRVPNALLFAGPDGVGKGLFAYAFAAAVIDPLQRNRQKIIQHCHPDIHEYRPEGKLGIHPIEAMRRFKEAVFLSPLEANKKIFIIYDAERMLPTSANALLKTFEEPSLDALIILISSRPELLLPTILSRCQKSFFQKIQEDEIALFLEKNDRLSPSEARSLALQANGSIGKALRLQKANGDPLRKKLFDTLAKGRNLSYHQIADTVSDWEEEFENLRKSITELASKQFYQNMIAENLTSLQKQAFEKEIEGLVALRLAEEGEAVLESFFSWFRDIHLIQVQGDPALLLNKNYQSILNQAASHQNPSLSQIASCLSDAKLALQRSTPFASCLETLLLQTAKEGS